MTEWKDKLYNELDDMITDGFNVEMIMDVIESELKQFAGEILRSYFDFNGDLNFEVRQLLQKRGIE